MAKKSELTFTNIHYHLSPCEWGEQYIVVDEEKALDMMEESCGERDENPEYEWMIEIAKDGEGNFYAYHEEWDEIAKCDDPDKSKDGFAWIGKFESFDDEDE